jgi:hypothetical protein
MTRTEHASIAESLARTCATCEIVRLRASSCAAQENLDMIGRLNEICALWVEMVVDARRTWHAARVSSPRVVY